MELVQLGNPDRRDHRDVFLDERLEVRSARGVRGAERALIEALEAPLEGRVLVVGSREGVAALAAAKLNPFAELHSFSFDGYEAARARRTFEANGAAGIRSRLGADLPEPGGFDWVLLPLPRAGDAQLAGELVREAWSALKPKGKLLSATDDGKDSWLRGRVRDVFGDVTILSTGPHGSAYVARRKLDHAPRERDFARSFTARVFGKTIDLATRPGVFSHGRLDDGTLALSEVVELTESSRVLDMGCGAGALGVGAALAAPRGFAVLVDSNARAARVAAGNISRNGVSPNAIAVLSHDFACLKGGVYDLVLANPPYYGDYRIVEHFVRQARRLLAAGGKLHLVTRAPERPVEIVREVFGRTAVVERRGYAVVGASR